MHNMLDIEKFTVAIYSEKNKEPKLWGSGILIMYKNKYYLVSAYHVLDREDEQLEIENDPEEVGIPHDDLDTFYAEGCTDTSRPYFVINNDFHGIPFTFYFDEVSQEAIINDDTEYGYCVLNENSVKCFLEKGKEFYDANNMPELVFKDGDTLILSGFPKYAQKKNNEIYRSYVGGNILRSNFLEKGLFRVKFNSNEVFCHQVSQYVSIRKVTRKTIEGMSSGGIWHNQKGNYFPVGLILKEYPELNQVECYSLKTILEDIDCQS